MGKKEAELGLPHFQVLERIAQGWEAPAAELIETGPALEAFQYVYRSPGRFQNEVFRITWLGRRWLGR